MNETPFDSAQGRPVDPAASGGLAQPFDPAQGRPVEPAQGQPASAAPAPAPPPAPAPAGHAPKGRRWFVVLAWVTLIVFALFVLGITLSVMFIPELRKARYGAVVPSERSEITDQRSKLISDLSRALPS